jgi:hypothetical protein
MADIEEKTTNLTARDISDKCEALKKYWDARDKKIADWYDILLMKDEFKEEGMESFVSNDPRTFYNMALHLLCASIPHRIPTNDLNPDEISAASTVEQTIERAWKDIDISYRNRGKQNFLRNLAGLIVATGWYSVFSYVDELGFYAEVWSPSEVYPEWDEFGLVKCARIYTMTKEAARRYIAVKKLPYNKSLNTDVKLYNFWWMDENNKVNNAIVLGDTIVKPSTVEPFLRIPIFVSPVGGLPDTGIIKTDDSWKEHLGESVFASNELVYKSYNKQWTFSNQLLRDTAQPRWFERSTSGSILRPEDMFKRGAVFKGGLQDSIEPLQVPPMPIELRTDRYDIQNMLQRGGLPWSMSGNIQSEMSGYLMAQVASSAMETLGPYHSAIKNCLADIDNFWLDEIKNNGYNPYKIKKLKISENFRMTAEYTLKIPGDVVQRATVSRMLNPQFTLSTTTIMDVLFPEIPNPIKEQALARKDSAMNSPISVQISMIAAYKQIALDLRAAGDTEQAALFEKAAQFAEQQIFPQQQQGQPQAQPGGPQIPQQNEPYTQQPRQEAMPRQTNQLPPMMPGQGSAQVGG